MTCNVLAILFLVHFVLNLVINNYCIIARLKHEHEINK